MITHQRLKERLNYNPETGVFTWAHGGRGYSAGDEAGSINDQGYRCIRIDRKIYRAHRLAWMYVYGEFPLGIIDHKDRNRDNNVITNLRDTTKAENRKNCNMHSSNKSGITGVMYYPPLDKWHAQITVSGKTIHLGYFEDKLAAHKARKDAERKYGFSETHGTTPTLTGETH